MPFKTRKKKIKAQSRHFVFNEGSVAIIDSGHAETVSSDRQDKELTPRELEIRELTRREALLISHELVIENLSNTRMDILKIIILSIFIIGGQIMLRLTLVK